MKDEEVKELLDKYFAGTCTPGEKVLVERAYNLQDSKNGGAIDEARLEALKAEVWNRLELGAARNYNAASELDVAPVKVARPLWPRIRIAASIAAAVATIVFGVWFFTYRSSDTSDSLQTGVYATDIAPGKSGATITLSTGEVIQLSDTKKGVIIDPASLTYDDGSKATGFSLQTETVMQMTAQTTKGQTYEFTLPDGTHVFLNADSKISFPSQFSGKERKIFLEGEAYFAVVHNEKQPFKVESKGANGKGQIVEDIGTEFNINAYADEASIKTTLVEGSASVKTFRHPEFISGSRKSNSALQGRDPDLHQDDAEMNSAQAERFKQGITLTPNQQASLSNGSISVKTVDPSYAIAWKNNEFMFEGERIENIMKMVERWYNVEVIYTGDKPQKTYTGAVSRFDNVSKVLDIIQQSGKVQFKITGRRIYVSQ